jgi:hypothetical protein
MFLFRKVFLLLLLIALPVVAQPKEENLLILGVKLDKTMLSEEIQGYTQVGTVLLPLGEVSRLLGLAITVKGDTAEGWLISHNRKVSIDTSTQKVFIEGVEKRYTTEEIQPAQGEIYISSHLLSEWLPITFSVSLNELTLTIKPREELPLQKRLAREEQAKQNKQRMGIEQKQYPLLEQPYLLLDCPIISENIQFNLSGGKVGMNSNTFIASDFLYHSGSAYITTNEKGIQEFRGSLGRTIQDNKYITSYLLGDTLYQGIDGISMSRADNGFSITNQKVGAQTNYDKQVFSGELKTGETIEVFQNENLIQFIPSNTEGRYLFEVQLIQGENYFRLVFWGEQGQRREQVYRYSTGNLTKQGNLLYRLNGNGFKGQYERASAEIDYGLTKAISISSSGTTLTLSTGQNRSYGAVGVRTYWQGLFMKADAITTGGGTLLGGSLSGKLGFLGLSVSHSELSNFVSEIYPLTLGMPITQRTSLRLTTTIQPLTITAWGQRDTLSDGSTVLQSNGRVSLNIWRTNVSNTLTYNGGSGIEPMAQGSLLVSRYLRGMRFSGQVDYSIKPNTSITSITGGIEKIIKDYALTAGISYSMYDNQPHLITGVSKVFKEVSIGLSTDVNKNPTAMLTINTSIARNPFTKQVMISSNSMAGNGAVAILATDADGVGVEGIGFEGKPDRTDKQGIAFIAGLPSGQSNIGVALNTLENPSSYPSIEGVKLYPRAGRIATLEIPIRTYGEVSGIVRNGTEPVSGVEVSLVDKNGKVNKIRSSFDGYYLFGKVSEGSYTLKVGKEERQIVVNKNGDSIEIDFKIKG